MMLPLAVVEWLYRVLRRTRPRLLVSDVSETPTEADVLDGMLYREVRERRVKWGHFRSPQCGKSVQIGLAQNSDWRLRVDMLRRPTISPSIWQTGGCGAHFFVRKGEIQWSHSMSDGLVHRGYRR